MFPRLKSAVHQYPRQFWLLTTVMMLAYFFHSLMWSFLLLYISLHLGQPLSNVSWLMTLNAAVGVAASFLGGAIADRFGRKGVMIFSLLLAAFGWFFFRLAGSLPVYALLMVVTGATTPVYRLTADAMVADLVPEEKRLDAYSLLRMGNNFGVAFGPAVGGFLVTVSYGLTFAIMGIGFAGIGILVALLIRETRSRNSDSPTTTAEEPGSYAMILRDKIFLQVLVAYSLNRICTSTLWMMLAAYTKQNYGLSESHYGFIPTTNAIMVITMQLLITRQVNRRKPPTAMAIGALVYAISIFCVAFGTGFWWFWLCMVGATIGEMILVPTTTTYTSRLAPPAMRARYMSLYNLTWSIGSGLGPLLAGFSSDLFSPQAMWYTAGLTGFLAFLIFAKLAWQKPTFMSSAARTGHL